jgi:hypothetical protein
VTQSQGHPSAGRVRGAILGGLFFLPAFVLNPTDGAWAGNDPPPVNLPGQIAAGIERCWAPPRPEPPQEIEVTVRLSFSRTGAVIGEPRVTYVRAPDETGLREKITASILAAIKACTPLPFTPSLGAAIAGRMLAIRFRSLPLSRKQRSV